MEKCVLERLEKMRDFLSEKANYLKMERIKGISEQFVSNEGNINSVCSLTKFTDMVLCQDLVQVKTRNFSPF